MKPYIKKLIFITLILAGIALAWISVSVLKLEKAQNAAAELAHREENIRASLTRLNSAVSSMLEKESQRPVFSTTPLAAEANKTTPPPKPSFIRSYFLLTPQGRLELLNPLAPTPAIFQNSPAHEKTGMGKFTHPVIRETPFLPHWQGNDLVFLKQFPTSSGSYTFAIWVDWPSLRKELLAEINTLLPHARLEPYSGHSDPARHYSLVTLPAVLIPGDTSPLLSDSSLLSPIQGTLLMVWLFSLLGAGGLFALLSATSSLSNRRAAFVSAVTHELRTPLTNFSLYTEMLEEDLIPEEKKGDYVKLLRAEASRLSHLVENVLAYSKLESKKHTPFLEPLTVEDLFHPIIRRLGELLSVKGFALHADLSPDAENLLLKTNRTAVEQILDNLADNALKYVDTASPAIQLTIEPSGNQLHVHFSDNGPGIEENALSRLFSPFFRSEGAAAGHKPGVGLGLALSRDTARMLGGDLTLEKASPDGASFLLTLPLG